MSGTIGSGLYITALVMILTPILFYPSMILGEGAGRAEVAGGFLGLVIWGFVFFLLAIVTGAVGFGLNRRAEKKTTADATTDRFFRRPMRRLFG